MLDRPLGIFRCLKAGTNVGFPDQGTPQGGVISPLLANIALNGIEDIHKSVRYADDMVFVLKPEDNAEAILTRVSEFWLFRIPYANVLHEQLRITQKAKSLVNPLNAFFLAY